MRAAVSKWGNSLAVRIPKEAAEAAGFQEGAALDLTIEDGAVTLRRKRYDIKELVAAMKGPPPPMEFEDEPRGSEVW
jgi:antitoxin MazE